MLQTRRPTRHRFFVVWASIIAGIVIIFLSPVDRLWQLSLAQLGRPLFAASQFVHQRLPDWGANNQLQLERDTYRQQVAQLSRALAELQTERELTASVNRLTSFLQQAKFSSLIAPVIGSSPDPGIQSLVIGKGRQDGLVVGLGVISDEGILVGKVQQIHDHTAIVLLITDSRSAVAARLQNTEESPGIIKGERGLALQMDFIPRNHSVQAGHTVVTSGQESHIPADILIGSVLRTSTRAGDLFHTAILATPVDFQRLRVVSVLLP